MLQTCKKLQLQILLDLNPFEFDSPKDLIDWGKTLARSYARHRRGADEGLEYSIEILPKVRQKMAGFVKVLPDWLAEDEIFSNKQRITAYDILESYIQLFEVEEEPVSDLEALAEEMAALAALELG